MGYRGRLIWPAQARIERYDPAATKANAIGGQPSGFDRHFREPVRNSAGDDARVYAAPIAIPCQVTTEKDKYDELVTIPGGRELEIDVRTTCHYGQLESDGLISATGSVVFQPSDRLASIYKKDSITLLRDFTSNPLYLIHVQDRSWGLDDLSRNLVMLYWADRREGTTP